MSGQHAFETVAYASSELQSIHEAFFRCLGQLAGEAVEGDALLHTEPLAAGQRVTVRLWSAAALAIFRTELNR